MSEHFDTLSLHAGLMPDRPSGRGGSALDDPALFLFRDADQAGALLELERGSDVEAQISNPATAMLEERIAALEGGVGALATASGQAALHLALVTLMGAGGHVVASRTLQGGARSLLACTLPRFGITTTFVDARDLDAWHAAIGPQTRLLFGPSLGGAGLEVLDIPRVAALAHEHGVPLLVDASLHSPALLRPCEHGADLVLHAVTPFLGGHGSLSGGLVVDAGSFDWTSGGRFATLSEPCPGCHDRVFAEESSVAAFLLRARCEGLRDFGAGLHPSAARRIVHGLETLPLRMARHLDNTRKVLAHLDRLPPGVIRTVTHPDRPEHPDHALARRLLPRGSSAVFSFELSGGQPAGQRFIAALQVFSRQARPGDGRSLAIHPASITPSRLAATGVSAGTIRLSIGLEDADDLIEDIERGLAAAARA
jgi:O-acetylhomoserine (thiol)-lyase